MVRHFPVRLQLKVLYKVLRAAALCSAGWTRNFCWSILGLLSAGNLGKSVEAWLTVENCEDWLFCLVGCKLHTLLYRTVLYAVLAVHIPYTF